MFAQSAAFWPKEKHVVVSVGNIAVTPACTTGHRKVASREVGPHSIQVWVNAQLRQLVIIQACTLDRWLIQQETEWLNKMQTNSGVGGKPDDIARVGSDLGMDQDYVHWHSITAAVAVRSYIVCGMTAEATPKRFKPIVGTLAYLWDRSSDTVLMIRRDARPDDDHLGKVNGLGGKVEHDEDVVACVRRELMEEANVVLDSLFLRGTITWSNFGPKQEDWLGFVFLCDSWTGDIPATNVEGTLEWIDRSRLLQACSDDPGVRAEADLPMWAGDRHFVPMVFDNDSRPFHGTMPYDGDQPLDWSFERL